jgi:hypothetical protein
MWNIFIGIVFIIGGLSGQMVIRGTNSSGGLAILGVGLVLWGGYRVVSAKVAPAELNEAASRQAPAAEQDLREAAGGAPSAPTQADPDSFDSWNL